MDNFMEHLINGVSFVILLVLAGALGFVIAILFATSLLSNLGDYNVNEDSPCNITNTSNLDDFLLL